IVPAALIISAELWKELSRVWSHYSRGPGICIEINPRSNKGETRAYIKWRSRRIWCRVRQRRVHAGLRGTAGAVKHPRNQAEIKSANRAGEETVARIASAPWNLKGVTGQIPISAEEATCPLPKISDHHNLGLIISRAGFDPCLPLAHIIRRSHVCVPVTPPDLQTTEFVNQKEIDDA